MSGTPTGTPNFTAALASLGGVTDWFSLLVATTWAATGLLLLVLGWLGLPRTPRNDKPSPRPRDGSAAARIIGGAVLAIAGTIAGTYTLIHGGAWPGLAEGGVFWSFDRIGPWFHSAFAWAWRELQIGWGWLALGVGRLIHLATVGFGAGVHAAPTIWGYRQYAPTNDIVLAVTAVLGGVAGWLSTRSRWRTSGVLTFLGVEFLVLGLVGFSLLSIESAPSPIAQGLGIGLVSIELFGLLLFIAYQYYSLEYLTGRDRFAEPAHRRIDPTWTPSVLVQVASFNEPPEIVENCLESVLRLEYPAERLAVQLADDSTDPAVVARLGAFCAARGIDFRHRADRRGFKGGALNDGLREFGRPVDLVAIVDSDYIVQPSFVRVGVQPFRAKEVAFVQTPQAYRNAVPGTFARWYALADAYFYRVVQPVRARAQSLIFCGTMGLIRTDALAAVGGWSEECVTEDAELSIRLLAAGWRGEYVPTTLGWGLAPDQLSAVRSQHRRWAFGGLQMLRMNREKLSGANLRLRQRLDFKISALFWSDGVFLLGVTAALTALVAASWFGVTLSLGSQAALAIVASAPLLLLMDGMMKIRVALRATTPVTLRDTLGILAFWYAIKLNDLRAAWHGWRGSTMPFVRTPKEAPTRPSRATAVRHALRDSRSETTIAVTVGSVAGITAYRWGMFRGIVPPWSDLAILVWLGYYSMCFASAPIFDYLSRRAVIVRTTGPPGAPRPSRPAPPTAPVEPRPDPNRPAEPTSGRAVPGG